LVVTGSSTSSSTIDFHFSFLCYRLLFAVRWSLQRRRYIK
jgi:hypothetical protein